MPEYGDLRVWHIPQVPGKPFTVPVESLVEAKLLLETLASYDAFQFENRIKPDYCNAGGLNIYQPDGSEDDGWCDWCSDNDGREIDKFTLAELRLLEEYHG